MTSKERNKIFLYYQIQNSYLKVMPSKILSPDRVLIGGDDEFAIELLADLYKNWVPNKKL